MEALMASRSFSDEEFAWLRTFPAEISRDDEIRCLPLAEDDHIKLLDHTRRRRQARLGRIARHPVPHGEADMSVGGVDDPGLPLALT
jgi:hypothetical protein